MLNPVPPVASWAIRVSRERWVVVWFSEAVQVPWTQLGFLNCPSLDPQTFLVPEERVPEFPQAAAKRARWARVEVSGPFADPQLFAAASSALGDVEVPFLAFSATTGLQLFVPHEKLGRALAALRQARLERFAAKA